ncbi:Vinculin [Holothuria leucospilota]|uniref:Vinculin n=1 Tax=Holothuria leucospilota TaxID=206669 RepID=A0A9Q1HH27_HOLLE|nr:Vinculin [Holothuria leucospilota]
MPSFHTKTIGQILEPVAQQVSELVILHEASEDGSAMPDLSQQIAVVNAAVQNLVRVGKETTASSKDQILKQDMPPAFTRVEEASNGLVEASVMLRDDPYSVPARKKLIEGARGILSGTAQLLLVFDQAEVRKILKHCQSVLDYITVAEVIEVMQDLVTFVKNLTPGLTAMAQMVSNRIQELTFQIHRELLQKHLDSAKNAVPLLMSSIKITVTTINAGGKGLQEAQENRNYVISKMSYDIREIMRVLQLTTYDEDEWAMDDITVIKKAQDNIASQMTQAKDWLRDPNAAPGGIGEGALRQILANARKIADRVNEPHASRISQAVDELTQMTDRLADLRAKGQGNTPEALQLSSAISAKLSQLQSLVNDATQDAIRNGTGKPANTLTGKMEQAQAWLANPLVNDKGVGRKAIEGLVLEGRKVAQTMTGPEKKELEQLCNEVESLYKQLDDLVKKGKGNTPEAQAIKQQLAKKLQELQSKIEKALAMQVVDSFMDTLGPLKQLEKAAKAPPDEPNREQTYESKATIFLKHGGQMVDTARAVADTGSCPDKKIVGELKATANEVAELTPQIVFAGKIVLHHPGNAAATENFDKLSEQYQNKVEKLTSAVDAATDAVEFIKASEESIKKDSEAVSTAISQRNQHNIVLNGGNIARKAKRIVVVANKEADNSEDPEFVNSVKDATKKLDQSTSDTVRAAKGISLNPADPGAQNNWFKSNGELLIDIERVKRPLIVIIPIEQQSPAPVDLPVRATNQANLQSAPPQRSLYTANAPQYQPPGTVQASPYAPKREGASAAPAQGDDFLRPQYVGSASRPSEQVPSVPPPPPAFGRASPKMTSVAQPCPDPVHVASASNPLHASEEPVVMSQTPAVAHTAPTPQQFDPTPQQLCPTPQQPVTLVPPSPLTATSSFTSPQLASETQQIPQHTHGTFQPSMIPDLAMTSESALPYDPTKVTLGTAQYQTPSSQPQHVAFSSGPALTSDPSVTFDPTKVTLGTAQYQAPSSQPQHVAFSSGPALTSDPSVTFDPTKVSQGRAQYNPPLSQPQHATISSSPAVTFDQSTPSNTASVPQGEVQHLPHDQYQLQHAAYISDPSVSSDPSSVSYEDMTQQNPAHADQHDMKYSYDHPSQHAPDQYRSSIHVSLHPLTSEDSLHAPQKSLPPHAYPSSQPTPIHGHTSPSSYQPASPSSKKPDYYQGASLYGPGSQSAAPAGISPRTTSQASQRPPQQQPLTVDTGVPYSPVVRSPYDQQQYAPFSSNRSPGRSPRQLQDDVSKVRHIVQVNAEPPLPPPPDISTLSISNEESAPPRPPLPEGQMPPPRPPPPEEEEEVHFPKPQTDEPIMKAAYDLHQEAQKWSSKGNDLIAAAKKMALLMAEMSKYVRGEGGSRKGLIDCAKAIAKASSEVTRLATEIARQCTDKRIRMNLMQVCERIPTIATQLKIISTVKATLLGEPGSEDEEEATEVLIGNAQNLMQAVKETVRSAEAASIKIRTDAGVKLRWVRKSPWYT